MIYLLTLGLAYAQECTGAVSSADLDAQLDSVAMGFLEMDADKIQKGLTSVQNRIPCLDETLDPIVAHEYHMLNGLFHLLKGDQEAANQALRLAKRLAPDKEVPDHLFPKGHHIHTVYEGLEYIELDSDIPSSARGVYIFNGQTVNRALGTNNIVQIKEGSDILLSTIITDGEDLPVAPAKSQTTAVSQQSNVVTTAKEPNVDLSNKKVSEDRSGLSKATKLWGSTLAVSTIGMAGTSFSFCGGLNLSNDVTNCVPNSSAETGGLRGLYIGYYLSLGTAVVSSLGLTQSLLSKSDDE